MVDGAVENLVDNISSVAAEIRQGEYLDVDDQHVLLDNVRHLVASTLDTSCLQRNIAGLLLDLSILFTNIDEYYNDAAYAKAFQSAWLDCIVGIVDTIYIPAEPKI